MKRLIALFLTLLLLLNVTGCQTPGLPDDSRPGTVSTDSVGDVGTPEESTTTQVDGTRTTTTQPGGTTTTAAKPTTTTTTRKTTTTTTAKPTTTAGNSQAALVDRAFALTGSATLQATLTGPVVSVREAYSDRYGNASFTIRVQGSDGSRDLYCYRCKPTGQAEVSVGDTVTLTGTIKNYNGTIEFDKASYTVAGGTTTTTKAPSAADIDENGIYDQKADVALYIHVYGKLPQNYVSKNHYENLGRPKDKCVGGNRFYNNEGLLPAGYTYYECDIDTLGTSSRGAKRIVYTLTGIVYYTADHYESFTQLYGAR